MKLKNLLPLLAYVSTIVLMDRKHVTEQIFCTDEPWECCEMLFRVLDREILSISVENDLGRAISITLDSPAFEIDSLA